MAEETKDNVTGFFQFTRNQFKKETFDDLKDFLDIPLKTDGTLDFDLTDYNTVNDFDKWRNSQMKDDLNKVFTDYTYGSNESHFRSIDNNNMIPLETSKLDETEDEATARLDKGILENSVYNWSVARIKRITSEKWSLWNVLYNLLYHLSKEHYFLTNVSNNSGSVVFEWLNDLYGNLSGIDSYDSKDHMREVFRKKATDLKNSSVGDDEGVATKAVGK